MKASWQNGSRFGAAGPAKPAGAVVLVVGSLIIFFRNGGKDEPRGFITIAALVAAGLVVAFGVLIVMRTVSRTRDRRCKRSEPNAIVTGCRLAETSKPSLALISKSQIVRYGGYFLTLIADDGGLRILGGRASAQEVLNIKWPEVAGPIEPMSIMEQTTSSNGLVVPVQLPDRTESLQIVLLNPGFPGIMPPSAKTTEILVRQLNACRGMKSGGSGVGDPR